MRRTTVVLIVAAALSGSACGDITAFCMSAGAPDGVKLVVTTTPSGLQCSQLFVVDTLPRASQSSDASAHATAPDSFTRADITH